MGVISESPQKVKQICSECGKTRETTTDRVPKGWKRTDKVYCDVCWSQRMVLSAIIIPVADILDGEWKDFDSSIHSMWAQTTQCSNWMITQLYVRDARRADQPKMPPMARVYLYPEARALFPQLPSQSVSALEKSTQATYRKKRYDIVWRNAASLPTYRYPAPFSLPNQAWTVELREDRIVVAVRIADRRWHLRLRSGARYHRQTAAVRHLINGGMQGSLDLYQRRIDGKQRVFCKMMAWLPRNTTKDNLEGTLIVRASPHSLLVATSAKNDMVWEYHADHIRRWSAEHRTQLGRWANDSKFEQRPTPPFQRRRELAGEKYRKRMSTAVQEIAASVVGYARRRRFAVVQYDDRDTSFCPGFPWFALKERLRRKLDEYGIMMEIEGRPVVDKPLGATSEE